MLIGVVPTDRKKERWQESIKTERDYNLAVSSGIAWLVFESLPLSWAGCLEELNKEKEFNGQQSDSL